MKKIEFIGFTPLTQDETGMLKGGFNKIATKSVITTIVYDTNANCHGASNLQIGDNTNTNCFSSCTCNK